MSTANMAAGSLALYLDIVRSIIGPIRQGRSLLDLGCGEMTNTRQLPFPRSLHIDVSDWPNRPKQFPFLQGDAPSILKGIGTKSFSVVLASDFIEHLSKSAGLALIEEMERVGQMSVIFTPLGSFCVNEQATNPDHHKSGWMPEEFEAVGWQTKVYPRWHVAMNCGAFFAWKGTV